MNLRIQTYGNIQLQLLLRKETQLMFYTDGVSVYAVLEKGLEDLMAMCDVVEEKFKLSRDDFVNKMEE